MRVPKAPLRGESAAQGQRGRGHLRFDRRFAAVGVDRLQRSSGTSDPAEFARLNRLLSDLATSPDGVSVIRAFALNLITVDELQLAGPSTGRRLTAAHCRQLLDGAAEQAQSAQATTSDPRGREDAATPSEPAERVMMRPQAPEAEPEDLIAYILGPRASSLELIEKPLWSTVFDELIPARNVDDATKRRYATSMRALRSKAQAFGMSAETYDVLADLSEAQWCALDAFRTRGVTVRELVELTSLQPPVRQQYLRQRGIRIGADLADRLGEITSDQWVAMHTAGDHPVGARHFEALDRLTADQRERLRDIARHLSADAKVRDLVHLTASDWTLLSVAWGNSAADWNHVRRALAATLTTLFHDNARHPVRVHVVNAMPLLPEEERVPDISPRAFWRIMEHVPEFARQFPLFLVTTGLRIGEYERLEPYHLHRDTYTIDVPGTKNAASRDTVSVSPDCWDLVENAVPAPFRYGWMRRRFRAACEAAGVHGVTLHDLRHCHGQWALENGAEEHEVQAQLRHKSIAMTRRYVKTLRKRNAAAAAARWILDARPPA